MDLSGGCGGNRGIKLSGAQPSSFGFSTNGGAYGNALTVSALNISSALTEVCSINVPDGKELIILTARLSGLLTTSGDLTVEIEIDGDTVLAGTTTGYTWDIAYFVGTDAAGAVNTRIVKELAAHSNVKVRAQKSSGTNVTLTMIYILVEK